MNAWSRIGAALFVALVTVCGGLFAAGQPPLTKSERVAIHARLMASGVAGMIPDMLAASPSGDVVLPLQFSGVDILHDSDIRKVVEGLVCPAQAVVVARAGIPASYPTARQEYIFSEWPFEVERILKTKSAYGIRPSSTITVIQWGGTIQVGDRTVSAGPPDNWPDVVTGGTYLIFLAARVPETGAFRMIDGIEIGPMRPFRKDERHPRTSQDEYVERYPRLRRMEATALLETVRRAEKKGRHNPACTGR